MSEKYEFWDGHYDRDTRAAARLAEADPTGTIAALQDEIERLRTNRNLWRVRTTQVVRERDEALALLRDIRVYVGENHAHPYDLGDKALRARTCALLEKHR